MLSTGDQKVIPQSDQEPSIIDVNHNAGMHTPTDTSTKKVPSDTAASSQPFKQSKDRFVHQGLHTEWQIGATMGLDSSTFKWLARRAAWTLTTFHVGGDGVT